MKLLLDTHIRLWALLDPEHRGPTTVALPSEALFIGGEAHEARAVGGA